MHMGKNYNTIRLPYLAEQALASLEHICFSQIDCNLRPN